MEGKSAIFPTYARYPITFAKGKGSRLWDDQGKEYLDFMTGIAVAGLGHAHPKLNQRLTEQMEQFWHISNLFHHPAQEKLAQLLTKHSCADAVFFCNSGAEANEAAIKLARRYNQLVLKRDRYEIITFHQSFHGRTLATLTATGQEKVQEGFAPLPAGFVYSPYNDIEALRSHINDRTCAIMLEMVQGEGGVRPADPEFIQAIAQLCKEHDLLLIADEIQAGLGRTGRWFAYEHYDVEPDIITLAKGLGNGIPIGAMLGKAKLTEAFNAGSHGSTFGGNPLAVAAAIGVLELLAEDDLPAQAGKMGTYLLDRLQAELAGHPAVREVRGLGLMIGIECTQPVAGLIAKLQEQGLLVIPAGPNVIRLLPALTLTQEDAEEGIAKLCSVITSESAIAAQA